MFDVFGSVKSLLKLDRVCIDNNIFRLHYKATVIILIVFSLLITSKQYIGDPIDCIVDGIPPIVMDTYCWTHSTYTISSKTTGIIGRSIAHPGVSSLTGETVVKYHKYYQWVCFCLFFQAMLFYIPRYLWKSWEGGRLNMLTLDLNCPIASETHKAEQLKLLVNYFRLNLHTQNFYVYKFFFCEVLNFINVLGQIYLTDIFLSGTFISYGSDVFKFMRMGLKDKSDPMSEVFPKVAKCTFHKYGSSGTIQNYDGLCVLPLNSVNEKIYVFLWFWFIFLTVVSGMSLLYRITVCWMTRFRLMLLHSKAHLLTQSEVKTIVEKFQIGDWFILYQLGKNIDSTIYNNLVSDLSTRFREKEGV